MKSPYTTDYVGLVKKSKKSLKREPSPKKCEKVTPTVITPPFINPPMHIRGDEEKLAQINLIAWKSNKTMYKMVIQHTCCVSGDHLNELVSPLGWMSITDSFIQTFFIPTLY